MSREQQGQIQDDATNGDQYKYWLNYRCLNNESISTWNIGSIVVILIEIIFIFGIFCLSTKKKKSMLVH